jgi:predicted SnoaL-like aldol condensation-catalyzing enzyme
MVHYYKESDCPGGSMAPSRKQQVIDLLKSLETKDPVPLAYVNPNKYIQHNLQVGSGPAGVAALIKNMPPDASVNTIRVFEDGDYVFAHTEYNFFGPRIGFDIFRFEDGLIVEHWDNLQETATEPSPSGHTMIDGPAIASDLDKTDANKALMQRYMDDLLAGRRKTFPSYFNGTEYIQHNPWVADTIPGLIAGLQALAAKKQAVVYKRVHMVLGEGNFVLVVAEATFGGVPTGIYDLFRIEKGRIAEHWDILEQWTIVPASGSELEYALKARDRFLAHPQFCRVSPRANRAKSIPMNGPTRCDIASLQQWDCITQSEYLAKLTMASPADREAEVRRNSSTILSKTRNERLTEEEVTRMKAFGAREPHLEKALEELAQLLCIQALPKIASVCTEAINKFGFEQIPEGPIFSQTLGNLVSTK